MSTSNLQHPTLDLAAYIGSALARPNLDPKRRALYHRIWAYMNADAHKRVCEAHSAALAEG
jgi:hypothetical protein